MAGSFATTSALVPFCTIAAKARGCRFCSKAGSRGPAGGNHGDATADEIGRQLRQAIIAAVGPAILDRHVAPLDVAHFREASAKCFEVARISAGRSWVQ